RLKMPLTRSSASAAQQQQDQQPAAMAAVPVPTDPSDSDLSTAAADHHQLKSDGSSSSSSSSIGHRGSPPPSLLTRVRDRAHIAYYRYEVTFGIYTMTVGEKMVAHGFVLVVLALVLWGVCIYLPTALLRQVGRLGWLLTGRNDTAWLGSIAAAPQPHAVVAAVGNASTVPPIKPDL
ncbi:hypothetical protein KEM52_003882, partial [Ascosphaera acerosa]